MLVCMQRSANHLQSDNGSAQKLFIVQKTKAGRAHFRCKRTACFSVVVPPRESAGAYDSRCYRIIVLCHADDEINKQLNTFCLDTKIIHYF